MSVVVTNNAWGQLSIAITATAKQILLNSGQGERFPSAVEGVSYFYATLIDSQNNLEIVKCTARQADTLTVIRGADNTEARAFPEGARIEVRPCAALLNDKVSKDEVADAIEDAKTVLRTEADNTYDTVQENIRAAKTELEGYVDAAVEGLPTKTELEKNYFKTSGGDISGGVKINTGTTGTSFEVYSTIGSITKLHGSELNVNFYTDTAQSRVYGGNIKADGTITAGGEILSNSSLRSGGTIKATGEITAGDRISAMYFQASSDIRKKKNVTPFLPNEGATLVSALCPVWFNWIVDGRHDVGLIAQEVQKVVPEVVRVGDDGYLTINYPALVAVAFAAIRDLQNEIKELKCRES